MEIAANLLNEKSSGKEKAQERAEKIRLDTSYFYF